MIYKIFIFVTMFLFLACSENKDRVYYKDNLDEAKTLLLKCYEAELKHHLLPKHEALLKEGGDTFLTQCREAKEALKSEKAHKPKAPKPKPPL